MGVKEEKPNELRLEATQTSTQQLVRRRSACLESLCPCDVLESLWVVRCFIGVIFGHSQVPGPLRGLEMVDFGSRG